MVSTKLIPALALMATSISALPTNDIFAIPDGTIPYCSDLLFSNDDTFREVNCTIRAENLDTFLFALPQFDIDTEEDSTSSLDPLVRRGKKKNKNENPQPTYPFIPENGRLLWQEESDLNSNSSTFKQCLNNGPVPSIADVKTLCAQVDSNYVIRRAGQNPLPNTNTKHMKNKNENENQDTQAGPCVCKVWSYKSAVFSVCNCDQCNPLIIPFGLRNKCREISQHCTTQGYSSGFINIPDAGALYEQHMTEKGEKADSKLTMGDLGEAMNATCSSGDVAKTGLYETGSFIKCRRVGVARECWRVTDPENVWYIRDR